MLAGGRREQLAFQRFRPPRLVWELHSRWMEIMRNSGTITLFSEFPPPSSGPSPFLVSVFFHAVLVAFIWIGWLHATRNAEVEPPLRFTVQILKLNQPAPALHWFRKTQSAPQTEASKPAAREIAAIRPPVPARSLAGESRTAARQASTRHLAPAPLLRLHAHQTPAPQTLVQPDLPPNLLAQRVPVPKVLMWSSKPVPIKLIVPPPMREVTAARVHPSLALPNQETNLADIKVAASVLPANVALLTPSTASPTVVEIPKLANRIPETTSRSVHPPAPARVMSVSDLVLLKGSTIVPDLNEIAPGTSDAIAGAFPTISPGDVVSQQLPSGAVSEKAATGDHGGTARGQGQTGENHGSGGETAALVSGGGSVSNPEAPAGEAAAESGPVPGAAAVTLIHRPKDGQFGFVVVGASLTQDDPEAGNLWAGRLVYSVYLHVGLAKSWILQYSLPRAAIATGALAQPKAPWPYLIVRPHLAPGDLDADAILVHGFVNAVGRFEKLAVVAPPQFEQAKFVIHSLDQWKFRPASENGKAVMVEVLLMIPGEGE